MMNMRAQANAEFLARELASARISLGRMEAALARIEDEQRERDERERDLGGHARHAERGRRGEHLEQVAGRIADEAPGRSPQVIAHVHLPSVLDDASERVLEIVDLEREVGARGRRALPFEQVDVVAVRQLEPGDARQVLDLPEPEDVAVEGGAALRAPASGTCTEA